MRLHFDGPTGPIEISDEVLNADRSSLASGPESSPLRLSYAAAHIVLKDEYAACEHSLERVPPPGEITPFIDWDATMGFRSRLDRLGFGIAEAMDTAQRFSLGWSNAKELIRRCGELGLCNGFTAGAGVDHLATIEAPEALVEGVVSQARVIQSAGGIPIILPMPWLSLNRRDPATYREVYGAIAEELDGPLFLHWLGEMFHRDLRGYFPGESFSEIMAAHPGCYRGAKLSLLDAELERRLRAELLARDQILLTGDDFHFASLIDGPEPLRSTQIAGRAVPLGDFSHALLGILDGVAEPAAVALRHLARGDRKAYRRLMAPCEALGRHLFEAPTTHYKAGLAFLAYLDGVQQNPMLIQHEERARSDAHLMEAVRLASRAGVFRDALLTLGRLEDWRRNR